MRKKDIITKNKKNILIITTSFPCLGKSTSGNFVYELAKRLVSSYNVTVLAPHYSGFKLREKWSGISVYRFRYFFTKWQKVCYGSGILPNIKKNKLLIFVLPFLFIFQFFALIKIIRKEKIDLINAHWVLPSGLTSLLVARIFNKPSVLTTHGPDVYTLIMKKGIIGFISRYVTNKVNQITATSTITAKLISKYSKIDENKIKVISMGVDTNYFYPSEKLKEKGQKFLKEKIGKLSNSPLLLYVGSLSIHKGVNYLIKAMPKILKKYESANLLIIGNGQQEDNLKKLSYKLGVNQNVHFIGSIKNDELPYYYNSADVFVLASLREGLPVVLMEAMSSGCPVVATNIAGNPDIIDNGKNGFLIKIKSPKEISQAVIKILSDEDLKNRFIKNARKTIKEKYDWQIIANKFKTIFNST